MAEGDTFVNALLGAVVTVILSFLMLSPLLGGLLAGYLEGGDRDDGLRVGAISGVIAIVPLVGLLLLFGGVLAVFLVGGLPARVGAVGAVFVLFGLAVISAFTVGLSALGGWLGNYLRVDAEVGS